MKDNHLKTSRYYIHCYFCMCWYCWCWHHGEYADSVAPDQPLIWELHCPLIYRIGIYWLFSGQCSSHDRWRGCAGWPGVSLSAYGISNPAGELVINYALQFCCLHERAIWARHVARDLAANDADNYQTGCIKIWTKTYTLPWLLIFNFSGARETFVTCHMRKV